MALVWATILVEVEVPDEILEEFEGNAFGWAVDDLSVNTEDGRYLSYQIEQADSDYIEPDM